MTLKSDVRNRNSLLGGYLRNEFPSGRNRRILAQVNERLASRLPICRLEAGTHPWVRGLIGHAIDYRIRLHFAPFRREHLNLAREGAWALASVGDFIRLLRSSPSRFPGYAFTQLGAAPGGSADWQPLCDEETEDGDFTIWKEPNADPDHGPRFSLLSALADALNPDPARKKLAPECILEFFELLDRTADGVAAHNRQPSASEERGLARFCLILAVFDSIRRSNRSQLPEFLEANALGEAESLLAAIPSPWVDDVAELADSFTQCHVDWHGAEATLNPTFKGSRDVGGADGDLIVNGCLWDIKTTLNKRAEGYWLYQLLGYVLLDYVNDHEIDRVGFLFPRQAASVCWNLQELADELSGTLEISIAAMRQDVCGLLRHRDRKYQSAVPDQHLARQKE